MSVRQNNTLFNRRSLAISREAANPSKILRFSGSSPLVYAIICVLYYTLLSISYVLEVQPKWWLMGFDINPSPIFVTLSITSIFVFFYCIRKRSEFNKLMLIFAFLTIYVPAMVYVSLSNPSIYLWLIFFISIIPLIYLSNIKIPIIRGGTISKESFIYIFIAIIGLLLMLLSIRVGVTQINFDLYAVYDFRDDIASRIGVRFNRMLSFVSKLFLPLLIIYALTLKGRIRYLLVTTGIVYALLIFGYWQHKSAVFLPVAVLALYAVLYKGNPEKRLLYMFLFLSFILAVEAIYLYMESNTYPGVLSSLLGRRALFIPAILTDFHIQFFSTNEKFFWYSITQHFGAASPSYGVAPAFAIGMNFFDSEDMSANVGFIGSGYANAGILGVILYSAILGLVLAYLNSQAKFLGSVFAFCTTILVIHTALASSDLITALRSHGLMLTMLIMPFLKRPR